MIRRVYDTLALQPRYWRIKSSSVPLRARIIAVSSTSLTYPPATLMRTGRWTIATTARASQTKIRRMRTATASARPATTLAQSATPIKVTPTRMA